MNSKQGINFGETCVKQFMTQRVTCLSADDTIQQAIERMSEERLAALPVVDYSDLCLGILSRSDLADLFVGMNQALDSISESEISFSVDYPDGFGTQVREFMNPEVVSITADRSLLEAARMMAQNHIHHLPVIEESGKLVGIISTLDIARAVAG